MSALTDKIQELAQAAQRYEEAQQALQPLRDAVAFAHLEIQDILEGKPVQPQPPQVLQPDPQPEQPPQE